MVAAFGSGYRIGLYILQIVFRVLLGPLKPITRPLTMFHAHLGDRCVAAIVITFGGFQGGSQGLPLLRKSVA
ncbi:hypothetical protein SAMN04489800_2425 [Pseudomonas deceptionensis]|uniref:Uncharacterized protein n=1 Tax=Pseudomonas deceptionensis TaxID=882211 RepID=A0A0J6GH90_PSEDM|nr:hypothetical protein TR67_03060 [Pseudomonas deceptionensis]SEE84730.1 hypothetical protein SAMN04489800_2425 [Pseudomonas deceptionensis]